MDERCVADCVLVSQGNIRTENSQQIETEKTSVDNEEKS